jgi:flagellar motility protein MotE (MotC chaperone)
MKNMPRILPLAGVAVVGVLAVNFMSGARTLPDMMSGAQAFAEELAGAKPEPTPAAKAAAAKPAAVCAPTAAELARQANLSPAELRILQNLGERRGQLDEREQGIDTQLQLIAAAEAKLDARVKALAALKGDVQALLGQADAQQEAEVGRLVAVFSAMKAKDAAARFNQLDESVRLPIAAKMKERTLAAILAQMSPAESKALTENLAKRFTGNKTLASARAAVAPEAATPAAPATAAAPPAGGPRPQAAAPAPARAPAPTPPAAAPAAKAG